MPRPGCCSRQMARLQAACSWVFHSQTTKPLPFSPTSAVALNNSAVGLNLGLWIRWSEWLVGFRYTYSRLHELDAVRFNKPYHTLHLIISFQPAGD